MVSTISLKDATLETMSQSNNKKIIDIVAYIKTTNNLPKINVLFDFGISILQHDSKTMEKIYDSAMTDYMCFDFLSKILVTKDKEKRKCFLLVGRNSLLNKIKCSAD